MEEFWRKLFESNRKPEIDKESLEKLKQIESLAEDMMSDIFQYALSREHLSYDCSRVNRSS